MKLHLLLSLILPTSSFAQQGADGNPHHWDRQRRCDQIDYDPPCDICEGVGGIPYGDENKDIHLTSCEALSTNASKPVHPVWGSQFTVTHYNEVLIGPKTDPFCFNSFPSNSSVGKLCYRPDSGRQVSRERERERERERCCICWVSLFFHDMLF